jgi:plasmid segregation protein ParM
LESGYSIVEFDCASHISKAKQDLSNVMILGSLAGFALQDYYAKHKKLPTDTVAVNVRTALALPIEEYRHYRQEYAARFKEGTHMVTIHTFEPRIRFEITFEDVQVLAEGAAAQYAIQEKGEPLVGAMLEVAMQNDPDFNSDGSIKASDVLQAQTVVGIDIGEGTVNYPVFQNGKFNPEASMSYDKGYGSIIIRAMERLKYMGHPFNSRKELVEYLQSTPSAIRRNQYNTITQVVQEETETFIIGVTQEFIKILSRIGTFLEVVYVYGGGSGPINKELTEELVKTGKEFGGGYPILYLEAKYSRNLNREGLLFIAKQVADLAKANASNEKK